MMNVYISPGDTVYFKIPINIGYANLSSLIKFICKDPNFMSSNGTTCSYPFDNPEELDRFLENMNSFPIQVNVCFKITDIEGNIYNKEQPVYAYFDIRKIRNNDNKEHMDYFITVSYTHLDVYKRQTICGGTRKILAISSSWNFRVSRNCAWSGGMES